MPFPDESKGEPFTLFINGGSTAMGIAAIQLAKLSGGTVITTASANNVEYLQGLGADHVLDYKSKNLAEDVLKAAGGPVDLFFEAYTQEDSPKLAAAVLNTSDKGKGKYLTLLPGQEDEVKALNPAIDASSSLAYSILGEPYWFEKEYFEGNQADYELQKKIVPVAEKLLAEGKLRVPRVFLNRGGAGLKGLLFGLKEVRDGNVRGGKLVYAPEDAA